MIISKSNKVIKLLANLKEKKYREKYNKYIVEGLKLADEIVNSKGDIPFEFIVYSQEILSNINGYDIFKKTIEDLKKTDNSKLIEVSKKVFEYISDTISPQGILVVLPIKQKTFEKFKEILDEKYIILDKIQDAGNMGTIIRSAVAFNVKNIICTSGCVDIYSPKVIRSTMGGIFKINIWQENSNNIEEYIKHLKDNNYKIISTDLNAKIKLNEIKKSSNNVYIFGNESNGISNKLLSLSDKCIKIEMEDIQESLNVSQAATICMYEEYMQNKAK